MYVIVPSGEAVEIVTPPEGFAVKEWWIDNKAYAVPKLYEYFGLIVLFYSNEHEPIHVHGKYQERESKAEIIFENGKFVEVRISEVTGKRPLDRQRLALFQQLVE